METKIAEIGGRKRTVGLVICDFCKIQFWKRKEFIQEYNFCCRKHYELYKKKTENKICPVCKENFECTYQRIKRTKSGHLFCSVKCKNIAQNSSGEQKLIQVKHYKNGKSNYRNKAFNNLPNKCCVCGYEKYIDILEVHHKDGNRNNNELENLRIICPNCHALVEKKILQL